MNSIPHRTTMVRVQMDRILESAVVLSWKDLLHSSQRALIHIESAPGPRLPCLKIWQLTGKGEWSLVCEYWPTDSPGDGMTFRNDYHSAALAEMLEVIMQHQDNFAPSVKPGAGLIQVTLPTEQENLASGGVHETRLSEFWAQLCPYPGGCGSVKPTFYQGIEVAVIEDNV